MFLSYYKLHLIVFSPPIFKFELENTVDSTTTAQPDEQLI